MFHFVSRHVELGLGHTHTTVSNGKSEFGSDFSPQSFKIYSHMLLRRDEDWSLNSDVL